MAITYKDVQDHIEKIRAHLEQLLRTLENQVRGAHDSNDNTPLPVHLTKWRVKSIDSAYLKTKRKSKASLSEITDFGGFRILCMFEQDILPVHRGLLRILEASRYKLEEFRIFNWHDEASIASMENEVRNKFPGRETASLRDDKDSGYRSLHYVVKQTVSGVECSVEIQLRTLLQDAWAELEHAISYKHGSIHPHIKKSFSLLARDLETNDTLIKHLRDINEKEQVGDAFSRNNFGPYEVFNYEDHMIPEMFRSNVELKARCGAYDEFVKTKPNGRVPNSWVAKARELYKCVIEKITVADSKLPRVDYWIQIESAFLDFCDANLLDKAAKQYEHLIREFPGYYVPYFRKGEIDFIKGRFEGALVSFDKCEEILSAANDLDKVNCYRVKVKLANVYWYMGSEYFRIALAKIREAEELAKSHLNAFAGRDADRRRLANNLCWYHLEVFLLAQEKCMGASGAEAKAAAREIAEVEFAEAAKRFAELEACLDASASANMFDTAAWFSFNAYKRTGDRSLLEKAKAYCTEGWSRQNEAVRSITSTNMHSNHTREIVSTNA